MPTRLDHITVVASDLDRSAAFYDRVLAAAGVARIVAHQDFEDEDEVGEEAVGYGHAGDPILWLVAGRTPTGGAHVALRVDDEATVSAVATAAGGTARRRDLDRPGYFGVAAVDPDGNTVEVYALS